MLKCATPLTEGIYSAAIASQLQEAKKCMYWCNTLHAEQTATKVEHLHHR
jgi:hypothetical protein